ncbi:hypothetical protein [Sphingomonas sp. PL20]|jgi:hypothetical protein|uniref:hypothetical protein n=2 Tax=Pseudomonadota TaxID=1224 RepID=UPI001AE32DB2
MIMTRSSRLRALALAGSILLSPAIASAQGQAAGQTSTQPAPPADASMPAGGMMEKHDAMPGMAGMPMQDDKMPAAMPPMAKKAGCCGMKKKPMAKPKAAPHRHAKPAAAKPAPMPADKPMPTKDDM